MEANAIRLAIRSCAVSRKSQSYFLLILPHSVSSRKSGIRLNKKRQIVIGIAFINKSLILPNYKCSVSNMKSIAFYRERCRLIKQNHVVKVQNDLTACVLVIFRIMEIENVLEFIITNSEGVLIRVLNIFGAVISSAVCAACILVAKEITSAKRKCNRKEHNTDNNNFSVFHDNLPSAACGGCTKC